MLYVELNRNPSKGIAIYNKLNRADFFVGKIQMKAPEKNAAKNNKVNIGDRCQTINPKLKKTRKSKKEI